MFLFVFPIVPGGAPQNFTASGISSTSVKLTWDQPAKNLRHGDIIMYEIIYYKRSEPIGVININTTNTQAIVGGLEREQDYISQIKAYTSKGAGPWSYHLAFRTTGQCKCMLTKILILSMQVCHKRCFIMVCMVCSQQRSFKGFISNC